MLLQLNDTYYRSPCLLMKFRHKLLTLNFKYLNTNSSMSPEEWQNVLMEATIPKSTQKNKIWHDPLTLKLMTITYVRLIDS